MRENNQQSFQPEQFRTGPTAPPKNHGGIIAVLLIAVIFLSGVVSIMGVMNVQLFRLLQNQQQPVSLQMHSDVANAGTHTPRTAAALDNQQVCLGITCHEITPFHQEYYQIPQGIYISYVEPESDCFAQGLRDGDILLSFNDTNVADFDTLLPLVKSCQPGDSARLHFYRNGAEHTITVTFSEHPGE